MWSRKHISNTVTYLVSDVRVSLVWRNAWNNSVNSHICLTAHHGPLWYHLRFCTASSSYCVESGYLASADRQMLGCCQPHSRAQCTRRADGTACSLCSWVHQLPRLASYSWEWAWVFPDTARVPLSGILHLVLCEMCTWLRKSVHFSVDAAPLHRLNQTTEELAVSVSPFALRITARSTTDRS